MTKMTKTDEIKISGARHESERCHKYYRGIQNGLLVCSHRFVASIGAGIFNRLLDGCANRLEKTLSGPESVTDC